MKQTFPLSTLFLTVVTANSALAQVPEEIVISATRQNIALSEIPRAVTVIDRQQITEQLAVSRNLAQVLANTVPGMAPASQTLTNFNQTLRGRKMLVLIDGVPQNSNRNSSRDLMTIDPLNIERIEVVRGGNAQYGNGASGGTINIITRANVAENITSIGMSSSLSQIDSKGMGARIEHYSGGGNERFDYSANIALEREGGFYDGDGDRIAPEPSQGDLSDTDSVSLAGKLRWKGEDSLVTLSLNHYDAKQDTDYFSSSAVNSQAAGSTKALAVEGLELSEQNRTRNSQINLSAALDNTAIGDIDSQVYYRNFHARFTPFDARAISSWNNLVQTYADSESYGGRIGVSTEVFEHSTLRWGADINREISESPVTTFDGEVYDNSGTTTYLDTGDRVFMPQLTHDTAALFSQYETNLSDKWRWEIGGRYEYVKASFDDFSTLGQGNAIKGGSVSYDDFLWNTGVTYHINQDVEAYASFSQGFELPDIGLQIRIANEAFDIATAELEPIKTDNYEIGLRADWQNTQASAAMFYSTSDLGSVRTQDFNLVLTRSEERIYGLELSLDHTLNDAWSVGGNFTWQKGENYNESSGEWVALNGYRIAPLQIHAYTTWQQSEKWAHRLQVNYSGARDDAFNDGVGFGGREVDAYTTLDLYSQLSLPRGQLSIGVENVLNKQYYTVYGQLLRNNSNSSHIPANGAVLRVGYQYQW